MPVLYVAFDEPYNCTKKSPYSEFTKKYNSFKGELDNKEIVLHLGNDINGGEFCNGFYIDGVFCSNPQLSFKFALTNSKNNKTTSTFIRMSYSFDYGDYDNLEVHLKKVQALKLRVPYLYLPYISYFDFNFQPDAEKLNWNFDVLIPDNEKIVEVCYSLINLLIALFAFDE